MLPAIIMLADFKYFSPKHVWCVQVLKYSRAGISRRLFYHCISCLRAYGGTLMLPVSLWEMMLAWWRLWIYVVIPISLKVRFSEQWEEIRSAGTISRHCRAHHRTHFPWVYHQKIISRVSASFQTLIDASISRVYRSYTTFVLPFFILEIQTGPEF